ncbi:transcription initiation factor IIF, alpha subunit [Dictyocaulus viviparus]|uniref:Transcription initiation factor IIF subunit alpha n=1 Tax=Dictyocaulus viviparus TaxID=29172 RepID=A0A0D8XHV3_DICVI|nr:transcription initiation factor IIF, alpha subunit [Dictyocaulus viviparus]
MAVHQPLKSEFVVKVPRKSEHKRFSVLKFNGMDRVDTSRWSMDSMVQMEREDNKSVTLSTQSVQEYGEGSEYGKAARDEARRKKYGRQTKSYKLDSQPWHLSFIEPDGRIRKMKSIREGGAGEHADYWVFLKSGEEFLAYKVDDWHKFLPAITHKTLDIDQAEEKFLERNKVMNQFALKAQILSQLKTGEDDGEGLEKPTKLLKIKDEYSSDDSEGDDDDRNDEDGVKRKETISKKKKAHERPKKDKRPHVENGDEVAKYESSDGEDEGREYDYMSDSGSDSEI